MEPPDLKIPEKRTGLADLSLKFLHFRHKHEGAWEVGEAILVLIIFVLLFFDEQTSHLIGLFSHALVGFLLFVKAACMLAYKISVKYGDPYGLGR